MDKKLEDKICKKSLVQVSSLLDDHFAQVIDAMNQEVINGAKRYTVNLSVVLEPIGAECIVKSKISYSTKRSDETEPELITDQLELPMVGPTDV